MTKPRVFKQIVGNAHARRELLWLRAHEKEDVDMARELEEIDPGLVDRLRAAGVDFADRSYELPRDRRERFGQLFDECYRRHELAAEALCRSTRELDTARDGYGPHGH